MIGKRDKFRGGLEKQTVLKMRWRRATDCSRGGIRQPEMHDRQQWTAVYIGSLAARMTMIGDGGVGWNQRCSECSWKDTVCSSSSSSSSDTSVIAMCAGLQWYSRHSASCNSNDITVKQFDDRWRRVTAACLSATC